MWIGLTATYWGCAGLLGYTYLGYPALISVASRLVRRRRPRAASEPEVSFVLAARNEAQHISGKIENLLELDYPADKLQVVVVSDGSSDATDEIVGGYDDRRVLLERLAEPSGKPSAINAGVARASGEIVVLCDARQRVDRGALREAVAHFADPQIAAVSGSLNMPAKEGPGFYWRYESWIRDAESRFDSTVNATGAFLALRRRLFRPLPATLLLDDLFTPLQLVMRGFRVVVEPKAAIFDHEAKLTGEFQRKARTLAGNYQLLQLLPQAINPLRNRVWLQFVSHKLMRLACPYALVGLFLANVGLVVTFAPGWPLYAATLAGQVGAYALAAKQAITGKGGKVSRLCHTFVVLNAAAVEGLRRYLKGDLGWSTVRHAQAVS